MELATAIETRTSVREFTSEPLNPDDIREIIRLAGLAPSINSYQPWKYYIISNHEVLHKMADTITNEIEKMPESESRMAKTLKNQAAWFSTFFRDAPMLIALAGRSYETDLEKGVRMTHDELERIKNFPDLQSAGASIQNLLLAATEKGYGTCWMTGPLYARNDLERILGIENPWQLLSFVVIGKTTKKEQKGRIKRNLADEMVVID